MKRLLFIFFFFCFVAKAFTQPKPFIIKGSVEGDKDIKYVYAYNNNYELVGKTDVKDGRFYLEQDFATHFKFDEQPFIIILLRKEIKDLIPRELANSNPFAYKVIKGEDINISFSAANSKFSVIGGPSNQLQYDFYKLRYESKIELDSIIKSIKLEVSDETERANLIYRTKKDRVMALTNNIADLILKNPDSEVALNNFMLSLVISPLITGHQLERVFNNFSERVRHTAQGYRIEKEVNDKLVSDIRTANPKYAVGMTLPNFELVDNHNKTIKNTEVYGTYTLIDFWATWCSPCREETPNLISAFNTFKDKGFNIIAISIDKEADRPLWLNVLEQDGMQNFINLFNDNANSGIAKELNINAIPANYLVDVSGKIIATNLRGDALAKKLKELLIENN